MFLRQPFIRKLSPNTIWLTFEGWASFAYALTFTVSMVYMVETVGLDPLQMVLVGTVLEITAFLFEIPTGVVADTYSRRVSIIMGSLLIGLGFIVQGAVVAFGAVLLAQVLWGCGVTFHSGASTAWLADEAGEASLGKTLLRGSQIARFAAFFGIIASVGLALINIQLAIVAGGVMHILLGVFLFCFMPEDGYHPAPREERQTFGTLTKTFRDGVGVVRVRPTLITLLAVSFVVGAWSEGYDRLNSVHLLTNFSLPAMPSVVLFGLIDIIGMFIGIAFAEVARRRIQTENARKVAQALIWIHVLMIAFIFILAAAENLLLALVALWTLGQLRGLVAPLEQSWINQGLESHVRATVLSMKSQTDAFGQIFGGPGIGYIGNVAGVRVSLGLGSVILAPVLLLYARTLRRPNLPPQIAVQETL